MPFFKWSEIEKDLITPAYSPALGPTIRGKRIEMGIFTYPAGGEGKTHKHPNEQIQTVIKGRATYTIAGEARTVGPGEAVLIPENTEHSMKVLEDLEVINCKNVVEGWSVKNARWE